MSAWRRAGSASRTAGINRVLDTLQRMSRVPNWRALVPPDAEGEGHDTVSPSGEVQASKSISKTALLTSRNRIGQLQVLPFGDSWRIRR